MSGKKQLWVLAGGNGAGKSTFYHQYLSEYGIKFVNADLIARAMDTDHPERLSYETATLATEMRETMKNIKTALPLVDEAWILDNSSGQNRFQQIAIIKSGYCEKKVNPLPAWAKDLLP